MTHASLFSGIGGPEIAAVMMGWRNAFHCDINPFGRAVLDYWFPNSESYGDIKTTDFKKWYGKIDVLTGGFPCQPFSYAGKRKGADDDRYLWPEFKRVIAEIRPTWVIGENVAGIVSMVEPGEVTPMASQATLFDEGDGVRGYRYEQPFTIDCVCSDLEGLGYSVQPILIPACAVGAPHRRDRVFIIARDVAANANLGANGGVAREDEGAGREERIQERNEVRKSDEPNQVRREGEGFASDANSSLLQCRNSQGSSDCKSGLRIKSLDCKAGLGRWDAFPSVSPVHRGNDGLPFDVDDLAISFSKWRAESLKAYGNAIVPQVMYEIFRAIELTEEHD